MVCDMVQGVAVRGVWCVADVPAGTHVGVERHVIPDRDIPINYFHLTHHI